MRHDRKFKTAPRIGEFSEGELSVIKYTKKRGPNAPDRGDGAGIRT